MNAKQANKILINRYLEAKGIIPTKTTNNYSMYLAPYRNDHQASLKVSHRENLWIDYGTNEGGTLIDLVLKIYPRLNVSEAIREIEKTTQLLFSFHQQKDTGRQTDASKIKDETSEIKAERSITKAETSKDKHPTAKTKHQISKVKNETSKHHHKESNLGYQISKRNHKKSDIKHQRIRIRKIGSLGMNPAITGYLHSRGIRLQTAQPFCKEIYYSVGERHYFGIGHRNAQGWSIRNKYWKGCTGQGYSYYNNQNDTLLMFEGIFDMLSFLELRKIDKCSADILILNSLVNIKKALPILEQYTLIKLYFDHDEAGRSVTQNILHQFPKAKDESGFYCFYKDLNEDHLKKPYQKMVNEEEYLKNENQ